MPDQHVETHEPEALVSVGEIRIGDLVGRRAGREPMEWWEVRLISRHVAYAWSERVDFLVEHVRDGRVRTEWVQRDARKNVHARRRRTG